MARLNLTRPSPAVRTIYTTMVAEELNRGWGPEDRLEMVRELWAGNWDPQMSRDRLSRIVSEWLYERQDYYREDEGYLHNAGLRALDRKLLRRLLYRMSREQWVDPYFERARQELLEDED